MATTLFRKRAYTPVPNASYEPSKNTTFTSQTWSRQATQTPKSSQAVTQPSPYVAPQKTTSTIFNGKPATVNWSIASTPQAPKMPTYNVDKNNSITDWNWDKYKLPNQNAQQAPQTQAPPTQQFQDQWTDISTPEAPPAPNIYDSARNRLDTSFARRTQQEREFADINSAAIGKIYDAQNASLRERQKLAQQRGQQVADQLPGQLKSIEDQAIQRSQQADELYGRQRREQSMARRSSDVNRANRFAALGSTDSGGHFGYTGQQRAADTQYEMDVADTESGRTNSLLDIENQKFTLQNEAKAAIQAEVYKFQDMVSQIDGQIGVNEATKAQQQIAAYNDMIKNVNSIGDEYDKNIFNISDKQAALGANANKLDPAKVQLATVGRAMTNQAKSYLTGQNGEIDPNKVSNLLSARGTFLGGKLNPARTPEQKQYEAFAKQAMDALIRARSGAAINDTELEMYTQKFFPYYGDDAQTAAVKLKNLDVAFGVYLGEAPNFGNTGQSFTTSTGNQFTVKG